MVTMKGNTLTLVGDEVRLGEPAPDFEVVDNDMSPVKLSFFENKVRIICSVPSLDTSVCDAETRRFNEQASKFSDDVVVLIISMDLPFAQKRWCGAAGVENVQTFSDHREASFGKAFGVLIRELRLLARAVFIVNKDGILSYKQIVGELTDEPDYEAVLEAVNDIARADD